MLIEEGNLPLVPKCIGIDMMATEQLISLQIGSNLPNDSHAQQPSATDSAQKVNQPFDIFFLQFQHYFFCFLPPDKLTFILTFRYRITKPHNVVCIHICIKQSQKRTLFPSIN